MPASRETEITPNERVSLPKPAISIVIPTRDAGAQLRRCLASLAEFVSADASIYVVDDATPDDSIREVCASMADYLPQLRYIRSEIHRGLVATCNWASTSIRPAQSDLLLLTQNTEATEGFLEEMQAVLYLHERHAVVCPRSSNATIFSIPLPEAEIDPGESHAIWRRVSQLLPRYQVMPTAASFCMLLKAEILDRFGLFDEAYSPEWYEADDFVCKVNRAGYSAVAANWAYVFHHETASTGSKQADLKDSHHDLLLYRYPEFERKLAKYKHLDRDPLERFASLYKTHRPRVLYDLFHLPPAYTGTSDFGLNLLRELAHIMAGELDLFVGMDPSQRFFAHELAGYRMFEDRADDPLVFDLVFKPCQILSWTEFRRMDRLAPRLSCTILDIIGVRCDYLNSPRREIVLQKGAELSDCVFTLSDFSRSDFAAFYREDLPLRPIHLGTNFGLTAGEFHRGDYVLVVGNNFAHKGVQDAIQHLPAEWPVIVLGGEGESASPRIRWLPSGNMSRQQVRELFSYARVVVYPSHYEGFGLPVVDSLALRKSVVVLDTAINRELASTLADSNLHRINSIRDLRSTVAQLFDTTPAVPSKEPRRWSDVAGDYALTFRELLNREVDLAKMRARWELLRTLEAVDRGEN